LLMVLFACCCCCIHNPCCLFFPPVLLTLCCSFFLSTRVLLGYSSSCSSSYVVHAQPAYVFVCCVCRLWCRVCPVGVVSVCYAKANVACFSKAKKHTYRNTQHKGQTTRYSAHIHMHGERICPHDLYIFACVMWCAMCVRCAVCRALFFCCCVDDDSFQFE
jgi:hypothetical protein